MIELRIRGNDIWIEGEDDNNNFISQMCFQPSYLDNYMNICAFERDIDTLYNYENPFIDYNDGENIKRNKINKFLSIALKSLLDDGNKKGLRHGFSYNLSYNTILSRRICHLDIHQLTGLNSIEIYYSRGYYTRNAIILSKKYLDDYLIKKYNDLYSSSLTFDILETLLFDYPEMFKITSDEKHIVISKKRLSAFVEDLKYLEIRK